MAMTGAGLKTAVRAALLAEFGTELETINDDTDLSDYSREQYEDRYWGAVCDAIVTYIQGNARATGADSSFDTHNLQIE